MKIIEKTDERIVLRKNPLGIWFCAVLAVVIGLFQVLFVAETLTLRCERSAAVCELERARLVGTQTTHFDAADLNGAALGRKRNSDGEILYRVELRINGETVPMTRAYSSVQRERSRIVHQVNGFVQGRYTSIAVTQGNEFWATFFGFVFLALGGVLFVCGRSKTLTLCFRDEELSLESKGIWTGALEYYRLDEIETVSLAPVWQLTQSGGDGQMQIQLLLKTGQSVPLSSSFKSADQQVAQALVDFWAARQEPEPSSEKKLARTEGATPEPRGAGPMAQQKQTSAEQWDDPSANW